MSDPRPIGTKEDFDQGTMTYVNRFLLYRRAMGILGEDMGGPWVRFDNLNRIEIPMGRSIRDAGFAPYQMVDVHSIYALTGRPDAPSESHITARVLHPNAPPGCIQVCFRKVGKIEIDNGFRIIDMEGSSGGLNNGGKLTLSPGATALDWVVEGVPYTVYEIYLICQIDTFPSEQGRRLLLELAHIMNSGTALSA